METAVRFRLDFKKYTLTFFRREKKAELECFRQTVRVPPKLRGKVWMCGNAANKKPLRKTTKQRASSNGSPAVISAAECIAAPPLPSHDRKQQRSKRQLGAPSARSTKTNTTRTSTSFHFCVLPLLLQLLPQYGGIQIDPRAVMPSRRTSKAIQTRVRVRLRVLSGRRILHETKRSKANRNSGPPATHWHNPTSLVRVTTPATPLGSLRRQRLSPTHTHTLVARTRDVERGAWVGRLPLNL